MTAPNHALTGALIGLTVANPLLALPAAFLSHFVLDVIPHYDVPGETHEQRMASKQFLIVQIVLGAVLCFALVVLLAVAQPKHWILAAFCAFIATTPDMLFIPRFVSVKKTGHDNLGTFWFWRFHNAIQWFQKPIGAIVEVIWFVSFGALLLARL